MNSGTETGQPHHGALVVHRAVVEKTAAQVAGELPDVWSAGGTRWPRLRGGSGSAERPRVEATLTGGLASLEVHLALPFPAPMRQITEQTRQHLSTRVHQLTGITVRAVDLRIDRVGGAPGGGPGERQGGRRLA